MRYTVDQLGRNCNKVLFLNLGRDDPESVALKMKDSFYYKGSCNDEDIKNGIKKEYIRALSRHILCRIYRANCTVAAVKVYCGATDASERQRRGVAMKEVNTLDFL